MCGICGYHSLAGRRLDESDAIIRRMSAVLEHRGPDQEGYHRDPTLRLGVRRLSIQDIPGGGQPVYNEDRSIAVVFNGEIYNFRELRDELAARGHRFATRCDTEVIVHAYEEFGMASLDRLEGQFAFALWDANAARLILARDRVGKKPLFYTRVGSTVVFASEIKSILRHPAVSRAVDPRCLDQMFTFFMPVNPRTMFKGIASLPPGRYLDIRDGEMREQIYWEPPVPDLHESARIPDEEWIARVRDELTRAVRSRMIADVPIGVFLSGGLDSSVIAAVMSQSSSSPLRTYSICHEDAYYDEGKYSDMVAHALGSDHHRLVVTSEQIAALIPTLVWRVEAPSCKTSTAAYIRLYEAARRSSTVILTGEGADEALAGYPNIRMLKALDFAERHPRLNARRLVDRVLPPGSTLRVMYHEPKPLSEADRERVIDRFGCVPADLQRYRSLASLKPALFSDDVLAELDGYSAEEEFARTLVNRERVQGRHFIQQTQYFEYLLKLPNYLLINPGDRAAMTHSVENRCPFLDHRFIECCMSLPLSLRVRGLCEKYALRKAFARDLPPEILRRTKRPFTTIYVSDIFRRHAPDYLNDALTDTAIRRAGLFRPSAVEDLTRRLRDPNLSRQEQVQLETPFSLVVTAQLWHQMFIEQAEPAAPAVASVGGGVSVGQTP